MTYRDAEDLIAHYAPASYLCDLMDSDWHLDHVTIFDFTKMLGGDGVAKLNENILLKAKECGFLDPSVAMSDTTAQEAMIPYPTEIGLMSRFSQLAQRAIGQLGGKFQGMRKSLKETVKKVKELVRNSHLFAKGKEQKAKVGRKIYHLQMSELYSIVRGKAGKNVEFGRKWGISRVGCGFLQGFLYAGGEHVSDKQFCIEAIKQHQKIFGDAPEVYGFDRGGYSAANIKKAKKMGVKQVGIAPTGKTPWAVSDSMRKRIVRERAQVEGGIGTIKSSRYGFNKPNAKSTAAMDWCGQRAILGFNMRKLTREWSTQQAAATAG